jgi:hypothetical protein
MHVQLARYSQGVDSTGKRIHNAHVSIFLSRAGAGHRPCKLCPPPARESNPETSPHRSCVDHYTNRPPAVPVTGLLDQSKPPGQRQASRSYSDYRSGVLTACRPRRGLAVRRRPKIVMPCCCLTIMDEFARRPSAKDRSTVRCIRFTGQLVRPTLRRRRQRGGAAEVTGRNALATSPGFSILLDVRRPDDGPRVDLAPWGPVASRRPGASRPRGASEAIFPPHYRPSLPGLPPRHRVVALQGYRRDATATPGQVGCG